MAPSEWPDEVDVFTVPHARMKQLVHRYIDMMTRTDFADMGNLTSLLHSLLTTFQEFMAHEQIENKFIMHKLKAKMQAQSVTNMAVCNCHSDDRLAEMLRLVSDGYHLAARSPRERLHFGQQLCQALDDFTQNFLPHMKEEEEIFQPLLMEYFSYEELCEIKATVMQQHLLSCDLEVSEEKLTNDRITSEQNREDSQAARWEGLKELPDEVLLQVMGYLSPQDLARCSQVNLRWQALVFDPSLWTSLQPVAWARGNWTFSWSSGDDFSGSMCQSTTMLLMDDDADIDESPESDAYEEDEPCVKLAHQEARLLTGVVRHLLPRIGKAVKQCSLAGSRGVTNSMVRWIMKLCPNLTRLDLSHTGISDEAFKGFATNGRRSCLQELSLAGCVNITDLTLARLGEAFCPPLANANSRPNPTHPQPPSCRLPQSQTNGLEWAESGVCLCGPSDSGGLSRGSLPDACCSVPVPVRERTPKCTVAEGKTYVGCLRTSGSACRKCVNSATVERVVQAVSECRVVDFGISSLPAPAQPALRSCKEKPVVETTSGSGCLKNCASSASPLLSLNLSGCFQLSDLGLRELTRRGGLPSLELLDLSGCPRLTGTALRPLVELCHRLDLAQLFYCDNMEDDPFKTTASGCRNVECPSRFCCRLGD